MQNKRTHHHHHHHHHQHHHHHHHQHHHHHHHHHHQVGGESVREKHLFTFSISTPNYHGRIHAVGWNRASSYPPWFTSQLWWLHFPISVAGDLKIGYPIPSTDQWKNPTNHGWFMVDTSVSILNPLVDHQFPSVSICKLHPIPPALASSQHRPRAAAGRTLVGDVSPPGSGQFGAKSDQTNKALTTKKTGFIGSWT